LAPIWGSLLLGVAIIIGVVILDKT
jgi:hypothetical protein